MNNHRNFLKKRIQTWLNQNPTPTFSDGVASSELTETQIRKKYKDLSNIIESLDNDISALLEQFKQNLPYDFRSMDLCVKWAGEIKGAILSSDEILSDEISDDCNKPVFETVSNFIDKAINCNYNDDSIDDEKLLNSDEKEKKREYLLSLFRTIREKVLDKNNLQQELNIILPLYRDIINRSHQQALNNWSQSIWK